MAAWASPEVDAPKPKWTLSVEGLSSRMPLNNVALPGRTGTRISLHELTGRGPFNTGRFTLTFAPRRHGEWRLMIQPLTLAGTGQLRSATDFGGATFATGVDTRGSYRFNSYRLTWRNTWIRTVRSHWQVGATLKVRDAEIVLAQGAQARRKRDMGVVPLLHVHGEERLSGPWSFTLDLDAAWAPQGRAEDLGVSLGFDLDPRSRITAGFRVLEGGADNKTVYTFSQFNSWTAGYVVRF